MIHDICVIFNSTMVAQGSGRGEEQTGISARFQFQNSGRLECMLTGLDSEGPGTRTPELGVEARGSKSHGHGRR
jgi:hypothetical protein